MATYTTLRIGSKGDDVKKLQQALGITADGIYGSQTAAAVKAYQKKNGLSVDGIAGNQTLGKLYGSSSSTTTNKTTTPTTTSAQIQAEIDNLGEFKYNTYTDPDSVIAAKKALEALQHPGEFQYGNQQMLEEAFNKIMNGEKFSYDLNGDALYQQYKDQYVNQGKLAMQDAIGQASAMTGGYGNSYAQSVGQQTYQGYLQQLNDKVPELYKLALDKYNMDRQELKDQYGMLLDDRDYEYGIYRDAVSDYNTERAYLTDEYRWQSDDAWNKYTTEEEQRLNEWNNKYGLLADARDYNYTLERDAIEDDQWQKTFDEGVRQYNLSLQKKNSVDDDDYDYDDDPVDDDDPIDDKPTNISSSEKYSQAYDYVIEQGVLPTMAASLLTVGEWGRRGKPNGTYEDYVDAFIAKHKVTLPK